MVLLTPMMTNVGIMWVMECRLQPLLLWRRLKRTCLKLFRLPFGYIWHHDALRSDSAGSAAMSFCHEPSCVSGVSFGAILLKNSPVAATG